MPLYRALTNLDAGKSEIKNGEVFMSEKISEKARLTLEGRGMIAAAHVPPLAALPGWRERADKLAAEGIVTVEEFVYADDNHVAVILGITVERVASLKAAAIENLKVSHDCGCGRRRI